MWRPALFLAVLLPFSGIIDWHVSDAVYSIHHCFYKKQALVSGIFYWGPTLVTTFAAFCIGIMIASYWKPSLVRWRAPAALFVLSWAVGLALVHGVKIAWPRPRPCQVIDFGGFAPYRALYEPLFDSGLTNFHSFPSAHAATGFSFFALYFAGRAMKLAWLKNVGLIAALIMGIALSTSRILAGGHFLFDTICAAAVMWYIPQFLLKKVGFHSVK